MLFSLYKGKDMKKTIDINGTEYTFKASGLTPILYADKFNGDMIADMDRLTKEYRKGDAIPPHLLAMFAQMAYIMNKQGDPSVSDDFYEWLDALEIFDIYEVLPQILELWNMNQQTHSTQKKRNAR